MIDKEHTWLKSMEWCGKYCRCHQMPERSFFFKGYQFPLCARCTGIALGYIVALVCLPFCALSRKGVRRGASCGHVSRRFVALMLPLAIDGTVQYFTPYESTNFRRVVSGFLYGFSFTSLILYIILDYIRPQIKQ